ncbi:Importin-9 like [Actinidia chinensis var. chinensis]|uniref:Importin-9 like n=1 Tax=Actinidia chinensis var. chinensis TaxID=1590841 RepID=A0A2R6PH98_ACTCC|nr:Importin-9 like [Actinidia chinensis var. chinensis]
MANVGDQDQQWLINCLNATLDTNHQVRSFAEASLHQASLQPGFGSALAKVAANKELTLGLRQLAAVLLKQFIKKHWQEDEETFEHPVVSSEEKATIRSRLLLLLDDFHRKICTAVSMAVASIAHYDWPEDWPDLLPLLLKLISDQTNMNGVHGALRCLTLLSGDLDDMVVPTLVPVLFPCLHTIVSSPQVYNKTLRAKALSIVYSCTSVLGVMSGVYKTETSGLISPMVPTWMDQFSIILEQPVQSEDPDDWSIRMEVLKCLNQFVQNFPNLAETQFMVVVRPLWQTFVSSLRVYEQSSIEGTEDPYEGRYDSDGAEQSLESFVIQLFEFLLTIVGSSKLVKVVANNIQELAYYTIAFLQMTEQQVHTWSLDVNQYVADEDDNTYSCRVSGALLLEEVVNCGGTEAIINVIDAAKKRFVESQQAKIAGSAAWWRMREATLFALASLSDQLLESEVSEHAGVDLGNFLGQIIAEDMGTGVNEYPFLFARLFSSIAKFSSVISHDVVEHFLYAAIKAIGMDVPPLVKVGACRALCQLLPDANNGMLQTHIMGLFSSLADLLTQASDETMHLVLETLQAAIKAGQEASASIEPTISPIILNMWASHISDPFISIDALEVLEAIKNAPGCIQPLVSRVLPFVGPILNKPQQQYNGLVAGALDLLTMLLKNSPSDVVKAVYDTCFNSVIRIVLQTDDHSEMQNATECLAALLSAGKQEVLTWGGDPGFTMRSLLDVASRLLDPDLESSGSLFVGSYILQLILHLPSQMAPHIRDLVAALVKRMQSSKIAGLRSSLLVIFARLVHMSAPHVEHFIELLVSVHAEGHDNSFVYVMSEWTKQQGEIQGSYQIKVTTMALALLLSTRHIQLGKINVQGHLIKSTAGITTRSKAKIAPDQWTSMSLPSKILALLADVLIEIQEQVMGGDGEDSEWEEAEAGDAEDHDLLYSVDATSYSRPSYEHLDAMAKVLNEDQDGDEDGLLIGADPLNEINLANYLFDFLVKFAQTDRPLFDHLCQSLTNAQQNAVQMVLNR